MHLVPSQFDDRHFGEVMDTFPVTPGEDAHGIAAAAFGFLGLSRGEIDAGGEPLDIPFERATEALVEVVDIEGETAIEGGIRAEIAHMGVPTELVQDAGVGLMAEVVCHHRNGAAKIAERRLGHTFVLDLEQMRQAVRGGAVEDRQGTTFGVLGIPVCVVRASHLLATALALRLTVLPGR